MTGNIIAVPDFLAYTIGIVVYLAGMRLNEWVPFLRGYNIPEPVVGGLIASVVFGLLYAVFDL